MNLWIVIAVKNKLDRIWVRKLKYLLQKKKKKIVQILLTWLTWNLVEKSSLAQGTAPNVLERIQVTRWG